MWSAVLAMPVPAKEQCMVTREPCSMQSTTPHSFLGVLVHMSELAKPTFYNTTTSERSQNDAN